MAKSLRSKWRRKMKAEKRQRYGAKENERLIKMLEQAGDYQVVQGVKKEPVDEPLEVESPLDTSQIVEILQANSNSTTTTTRSRSRSRHDQRRLSRRSRRDDNSDQDDDGNGETKEDETEKPMDVTKDKVERVYNKRTKKDQFGNYPAWFSLRKIGKQKKKNKRLVSKQYKLKNKKK